MLEVDVTAYGIGDDELQSNGVANIEAAAAAHDTTFNGRTQHARVGTLGRRRCDNRREALAHALSEHRCSRDFSHCALDLPRRFTALGASAGDLD